MAPRVFLESFDKYLTAIRRPHHPWLINFKNIPAIHPFTGSQRSSSSSSGTKSILQMVKRKAEGEKGFLFYEIPIRDAREQNLQEFSDSFNAWMKDDWKGALDVVHEWLLLHHKMCFIINLMLGCESSTQWRTTFVSDGPHVSSIAHPPLGRADVLGIFSHYLNIHLPARHITDVD